MGRRRMDDRTGESNGGEMTLHRIVPNLKVAGAGAGHDFYTDFLGLEKAFDLGWIASFRSPDNRSIQVSLVSEDASAPEDSAISVNVSDVDAAYARARELGYEIVHPLTEEPWALGASSSATRTALSSTWSVTPTDSPAAVVPLPDPLRSPADRRASRSLSGQGVRRARCPFSRIARASTYALRDNPRLRR